MSWANEPMLAFDLETSGVDPHGDRIATACAAIVKDGVVTFQRDWMIAIDVEMPAEASAVNRLTTETLRTNGRPANDVIPEIVNALRYAVHSQMPIVAYKAAFDITFTNSEAQRWIGQDLAALIGSPIHPVLDPFVLWKQVERFRKGKRQLSNACEAFGVPLGENAHEAAADAVAAVRVLLAIAAAKPQIGRMTPPQLHEAQTQWCREQCDGLREYLDSRGEKHDGVPGGWPMYAAAVTAQ